MSNENPRLGRFIVTAAGGENVRAFVPPPLPPDPAIDMTELVSHLSEADRALGRLDGISKLLPNKELFLYMYVRKEAVLSSQIEGTQSTLSDLLRAEAEQLEAQKFDDVTEVSNYVEAMNYGLKRMETLPISLRLIREMHEILLKKGRGAGKNPGQFRRTQNWIGGTRPGNAVYVPPPPVEMEACLDSLEKFIHSEQRELPPLIKAGLVHLQFESIHPFLDGNGRIGRLLITLLLCAEGVLKEPLLYLSLYFKSKRADYYRLLQEVRERGSWETWLEFFLDGITETANEAVASATKISELLEADLARVKAAGKLTGSVQRIVEFIKKHPYLTAAVTVQKTGLTLPTVNSAIATLEELGILREITGRRRDRVYEYEAYMSILQDRQKQELREAD
jgi:Fic family protein